MFRHHGVIFKELLNYFTKTLGLYCKPLLAFHVFWSSGGASDVWCYGGLVAVILSGLRPHDDDNLLWSFM